jgi:hypothetical protein
MTSFDPDALRQLRAVAAMLGEPYASDLAQLLDAASGRLPAIAEQPQAIRYRLLLDDLAASIQAGEPPAALLARIKRAVGEDSAAEPERAALEGVAAAAEAIREVLAARDPDGGLTWMFGPADICARFDALDQALDALDSARSMLDLCADTLEQRAADAVRLLLDNRTAGTAALIALVGGRTGRILAAAIRRELRQRGGKYVHPPACGVNHAVLLLWRRQHRRAHAARSRRYNQYPG